MKVEVLEAYREGKKVFPFQTVNSLADRWNVGRGVVFNWSMRHKNFPEAVQGFIEGKSHNQRIFPMYEIERYEKEKGLLK
jgi:hypothetical protein